LHAKNETGKDDNIEKEYFEKFRKEGCLKMVISNLILRMRILKNK
jgi:hypothetical protein